MIDPAAIPWAALVPFIIVGFLAQCIDSALGVAFSVVSNTLLALLGLPPTASSAATHTAESLTSGIAGVSHALRGNVDWPLFARLVTPGILGSAVGVWVLTSINTDIARAIVLVYLAAVGIYLLWRAPRRPQAYRRMRLVGPLGLVGGFLDASGGGGWGPIVTGNLLAQGMTPRMAIGTANAAKFFVTVTVLASFVGALGIEAFTIAVSGLLIGGVVAAPLGAWLTRRMPSKALLQIVGSALVLIALWGFASLMFEPVPVFARF